MQKNSTVLLVVAAALLDRDQRVLMQQRRQDADHGELWEFPGGKVEPGETPESALVREIAEELGVILDPADLHAAGFASGCASDPGGGRPLVILLYTCRRWQGQPRCLDGQAIEWCAVDKLSSLPMPPLDYPLAERLAEAIAVNHV